MTTSSKKNDTQKSDSIVESLLEVFENICDPFNFELGKTGDTLPLVYVTKGAFLKRNVEHFTFG